MIELPLHFDLDNKEFRQAWRILKETNRSVFLTGRAGTGKSTFLRYICDNIGKETVVLAPTGVAAVNVGGMTIHSFFQIPLRPVPPDDPEFSFRNLSHSLKYSRQKRNLLKKVELIIIDEISMVRPDILDFIDRVLRYIMRQPKLPFGGKQLLLVGDVFQLEPVVTTDAAKILRLYYKNFHFFEAVVFSKTPLITIELKKVYRQEDKSFIELLDKFRTNTASVNDYVSINKRIKDKSGKTAIQDFTITLTARRETADEINRQKMDELPEKKHIFKGKTKGKFPDSLLPTEMELEVKTGAQVMLIKNDKERRWVNGSLAQIIEIEDDEITIALESGEIYSLEKVQWENMRFYYDEEDKCVKEEVLGVFYQYPIRPAWALTVHKSQGLTFNNVIIDLDGGAFSPGQTYVALSRCKSLEGLSLNSPITEKDIIISENAVNFSKSYNDQNHIRNILAGYRADTHLEEAQKRYNQGNFREAINELYDALCYRNDMNDPAFRRLIASKFTVISKQEKELKRLNIKVNQACDEFLKQAEMAASQNNGDLEKDWIEKAYNLSPDYIPAALEMARMLLLDESPDEAMSLIKPYLKFRGKYGVKALTLKGSYHIIKNEKKKALSAYKKALKLDKGNEELIKLIEELSGG